MPKNSHYKKNRARKSGHRERHLSIRSELRKQPDVHKIARAVVALAIAQAEASAAAERQQAEVTQHKTEDSSNG